MLLIFGLGPLGYPPKSVSMVKEETEFSIETEFCFHRNRIFAGQMVAARYNLRTKSMGTKVGWEKIVYKL